MSAFDKMEIMLADIEVMSYLPDVYIDRNSIFSSKISVKKLSNLKALTNVCNIFHVRFNTLSYTS